MGDFLDNLQWPPEPGPMLFWIVALPLFAAMINGFFGRGANKGLVSAVAVGSVAISFFLSLYCFVTLFGAEGDAANDAIVFDAWQWFSVQVGEQDVPVRVRFLMDHLSGVMTVMVTGIAALIHVYSTEYMGEDPSYSRFMTYLNLFTASMLVLVLGSNIPMMFVGWEGVGLCSYLLIGFWWTNPAYAAAGRKAFVVNRIGDFGVLIGTFILLGFCHTFEFTEINARIVEYGQRIIDLGGVPIGITVATGAALFLFLGCTGKSAQLPLYVWLPDAMAGPTPVSALIHAATMVTAGVYLCCRLSPVFMLSETAMATIALTGALTALLGATIGVVQNQMKKILAYSTVSQLGFMFAAVGSGAFAGGFFHVFTHAFFKACLFLGAGSVMHAVHAHGDADIRYLGGMRKHMPRTHLTFAVACAAIAGVPLTSGFFSKDDILFGALESTEHLGVVGYVVFAMLSVAAFLTAFYMFRLYFLTFWGTFRGGHAPSENGAAPAEGEGHDPHEGEPHESGDAVTIPLVVLALGALVAGFLGLPHWMGLPNWWAHWLTGEGDQLGAVARWMAEVGAESEGHQPPGWFGPLAMAVGTAVGLGGIGLAWVRYKDKDAIDVPLETNVVRGALIAGGALGLGYIGYRVYEIASTGEAVGGGKWVGFALLAAIAIFALAMASRPVEILHAWAFDKWRVDELYGAAIVGPFRWLAVVAANMDRIAVDGLLTWLPAQLARLGGWLISRAQSGVIYGYTVGLTLGTAALVWWFTYPHTALEADTEGAPSVVWHADPGPGYEYRWDFDSDGEWDTDWSAEADATHAYGPADSYFGLVIQLDDPGHEGGPLEFEPGEREVVLPIDEVTAEWVRPGEGGHAPEHPRPPTVRLEGARVLLVAHDALVTGAERVGGEEQEQYELAPGDSARVGTATVRVAVRARATVQVRNAFGNLTREREEIVLRVPHTELEPVATIGGAL